MAIKVSNLQKQVKNKSKFHIYGVLVLAGILLSICTQYFIMQAGIYTPGLSGIAQGISYVVSDLIPNSGDQQLLKLMIYWIIYSLLNVPIFFFMFRWYGTKFSLRTIIVFISSLTFGLFLANVQPFDGIQIVPKTSTDSDLLNFVRIFILSIIGATMYGFSLGLTLKNGGSTAGADPIVKYISREKGINLSKVLFITGLSISLLFIIVRAFTDTNKDAKTFEEFLKYTIASAEFISTISFMVIYAKITESMYSPTKRIEVSVASKKNLELSNLLNKSNYHRGHTLIKAIGGYSREEIFGLKMVINIEEFDDISKIIESVDSNAMITAHWINRLYDLHDWTPITKYDLELKEKRHNATKEIEKKEKNVKDKDLSRKNNGDLKKTLKAKNK